MEEELVSRLFSSIKIRGIEFKNRIGLSPMCQYSSKNGMPNEWHFVHLGSRAVGGAALILTEAAAVSPEGRISPDDLGIWNTDQSVALEKITFFIKSQNAVPGIQLAHAGRKASTYSPWKGRGSVSIKDGGWETIAPSPIKFDEDFTLPKEMNETDIRLIINQFKESAVRAVEAGFQVIEIHMAHGYLVHQFLSPLTNIRKDKYGGSLENRCSLALEIASSLREVIPETIPLFLRISATDWIANGWDIEQSVYLAEKLKEAGVDLIDCSSGGIKPGIKIPAEPGYQVPFAERIKNEAGILTAAVGLITTPFEAEKIISENRADVVLLGKELLRDPYWALRAASELSSETEFPVQYLPAKNGKINQ